MVKQLQPGDLDPAVLVATEADRAVDARQVVADALSEADRPPILCPLPVALALARRALTAEAEVERLRKLIVRAVRNGTVVAVRWRRHQHD